MCLIYWLLLVLLIVGASVSFYNKNFDKFFYNLLFVLMTLMLCFRYGQGTDYVNYNLYYYGYTPDRFTYDFYFNFYGNVEIGYRFIMNVFRVFKLSSTVFFGVVSLFMMYMLRRYINRCESYKTLTLLLFYPTFYLTYYFCMIRQAIVMAVFIGILLPLLQDKKFLKYYIVSCLALLFHKSGVLLLVFPLLYKVPYKAIIGSIGFAVIFVFLSYTSIGTALLQSFNSVYFSRINISFFALFERITMFALVYMLAYNAEKNNRLTHELLMELKIYAFGFVLYLFLLSFPEINSRLVGLVKILEVGLIAQLLYEGKGYRQVALAVLVVIVTGMFVKNIYTYIEQGEYFDKITVFNYPYISIFNKKELYQMRHVYDIFRYYLK